MPLSLSLFVIHKKRIASTKIADDAITTAKIADSAITTAKIADSAITTAKIADSAITSVKIQSNTISRDLIRNSSIFPTYLKQYARFSNTTPLNLLVSVTLRKLTSETITLAYITPYSVYKTTSNGTAEKLNTSTAFYCETYTPISPTSLGMIISVDGDSTNSIDYSLPLSTATTNTIVFRIDNVHKEIEEWIGDISTIKEWYLDLSFDGSLAIVYPNVAITAVNIQSL